jgi:hypothetical protein
MDEAGEAGALARRRPLQHLQITVRILERKKNQAAADEAVR